MFERTSAFKNTSPEPASQRRSGRRFSIKICKFIISQKPFFFFFFTSGLRPPSGLCSQRRHGHVFVPRGCRRGVITVGGLEEGGARGSGPAPVWAFLLGPPSACARKQSAPTVTVARPGRPCVDVLRCPRVCLRRHGAPALCPRQPKQAAA